MDSIESLSVAILVETSVPTSSLVAPRENLHFGHGRLLANHLGGPEENHGTADSQWAEADLAEYKCPEDQQGPEPWDSQWAEAANAAEDHQPWPAPDHAQYESVNNGQPSTTVVEASAMPALNSEAPRSEAVSMEVDSPAADNTRSDDNTKATDFTRLLLAMQRIQESLLEHTKQQNDMNQRMAEIETKMRANYFNSVLSRAGTGCGSICKGSADAASAGKGSIRSISSVASVTPSNHSSSPFPQPPLHAQNRGCLWHGSPSLRSVMTTDLICAPPRSNKVDNWVAHFYNAFSNEGFQAFGDAFTKAIHTCNDPVSAACGATVYYYQNQQGDKHR